MPTSNEERSRTVETTGHEWDGIQEYNNPLPKWWLWVFYATIAWSLVYMVLYPSIPGVTGYFGGILGYDSRAQVERDLAEARLAQGELRERLVAADIDQIFDDPDLFQFALAGGRVAFGDNCAPCHGPGGQGRPGGYPSLADDAWIWGGTPRDILHTIEVGIRHTVDDTRFSEMPAFGALGILDRQEVNEVADYVFALGPRGEDIEPTEEGRQLFADNCAACHGQDGTGMRDVGAPNLTDAIWLFGGDRESIARQIWEPQHGVMPHWRGRLEDSTLKMLTVYVHSLGGGE